MIRRTLRLLSASVAALFAAAGPVTPIASAQTGACCLPTYCVEGYDEPTCASWGGNFFADQTCLTAGCVGACCDPYGNCSETTQSNCQQDPDNVYRGNGVACSGVTCTPNLGSCCFSYGCSENYPQNDCVQSGGQWNAGKSCLAAGCVGACCDPYGNCSEVTESTCLQNPDSVYQGNGVACSSVTCVPNLGSCCYQFSCNDGVPMNACTGSGGQWTQGGTCLGTGCVGACCDPYGNCSLQTKDQCNSDPDNTFRGGGVDCSAVTCTPNLGSCCYQFSCNDNVPMNDCTGSGGQWTAGATCLSTGCTGACCDPYGNCSLQTKDQCESDPDNIYAGGKVACEEITCEPRTGACCNGAFCNDNVPENDCVSGGGTFNQGITCAEASCGGACCLGSTCVDGLTPTQCAQAGGVFGGSLSLCSSILCTSECTNTATLVSNAFRIFPSSIAIEDLNRDGWFDVVFISEDPQLLSLQAPAVSCGDGAEAGAFGGGGGTDRCGGGTSLRVHVLSGATNYASELTGWPVSLQPSTFTPTVAIGDINFDGGLDVLVGSGTTMKAFRSNGSITPGWENADTLWTFQNAAAFGDCNFDGSPDLICVDESTFYQRFQSLARKWQCQFVTDPVVSSPAWGDVGRKHATNPLVADGIPDAVTCGESRFSGPNPIRVFNTFGTKIECQGASGSFSDQIFEIQPLNVWHASPALARLDRNAQNALDATQDIVLVDTSGVLRVYHNTFPTSPAAVSVDDGSPRDPRVCIPHYSSPAIVDLNSDSLRQEIIVGSDDGRVYAFRYDPTIADPTARLVPLAGWSGGVLLDPGAAVSASPIIADVIGDTRPEVIVANDAGKVYILNWQGSILGSWCCRSTAYATDASAIYSTPAVWVRRPASAAGSATRKPIIFAGNRHGLWRIDLSSSPDFVASRATWPTFHKDNARTGSWLDYAQNAVAGSIGGIVCSERGGTLCEIFKDDTLTQPVEDPQIAGQPYTMISVSDGRFVFDMLKPGTYFVRFTNGLDVQVKKIPVVAGKMTYVKGCCLRLDPGGRPVLSGSQIAALLQRLADLQNTGSGGDDNGAPSDAFTLIEILTDVYAIDPYCVQ